MQTLAVDQALEDEEISAQDFMSELNVEIDRRRNIEVQADWNYATNLTDANEKRKTEISAENAEFLKVSISKIPTIVTLLLPEAARRMSLYFYCLGGIHTFN